MDHHLSQHSLQDTHDSVSPKAASKPENLRPALRSNDWQQTSQPVFVVEDSFYRSRTPPRPIHWSIAWSDLMMTMFILFLTLFVHQRTHQDIQAHGIPTKSADETMPVQAEDSNNTLIFHPISQDVSLRISENVEEIMPPSQEQPGADVLIRHQLAEDRPRTGSPAPIPEIPQPTSAAQPTAPQTMPVATNQPAISSPHNQEELITKIYDLSKIALEQEKLERFASVELIPDKTMRIILTGDLLFASGQVELTANAVASLQKLSAIIRKTPYMINVIGHTDDRPVKTTLFPSNWELSLTRAGRVARFLMEDTGLPPAQFQVTGYSSYRPLRPNTSAENRRINRRVEIVLSKELPQVQAMPPADLQQQELRQ